MAAGVTFGSEDIRYKDKKVPEVEKVVAHLDDVEMESVPEEAVQAAPAPRFECASL